MNPHDLLFNECENMEEQLEKWVMGSEEEDKLEIKLVGSVINSENHQRRSFTRRTINRHREDGALRLFNDYFAEQPTYTEEQFRRRFRMSKHIFIRIVEALRNYSPYFQQRSNAAGTPGLSTLQKCTAAIRMLAYGSPADVVDDYVRLGESTALLCLKEFVKGINHIFDDEYMRKPNADDLDRLLQVGKDRGFPGMLGSIDCMHWPWINCPAGWKGQFARGDHGKPTIILEAVASYDLWIWHSFFGVPGTCNDINVLDRSPLFDDVEYGRAPEVKFTVNGNEYNLGYYLADGIYPPWATLVQTIRLPQSAKDKLFSQHQEGARKDVERAFGVLQKRFAIIRSEARIWDKKLLGEIMRACIILHNMIVEDSRHTYSLQPGIFDLNDEGSNFNIIDHMGYNPTVAEMYANRRKLYNKETHKRLQKDLTEHIWEKFGPNRYGS